MATLTAPLLAASLSFIPFKMIIITTIKNEKKKYFLYVYTIARKPSHALYLAK